MTLEDERIQQSVLITHEGKRLEGEVRHTIQDVGTEEVVYDIPRIGSLRFRATTDSVTINYDLSRHRVRVFDYHGNDLTKVGESRVSPKNPSLLFANQRTFRGVRITWMEEIKPEEQTT